MSAVHAVAVAVIFTWMGMVIAISFIEAPLNFQAPGVSLPIGLGIGRLVFRALNAIEVVLAMSAPVDPVGASRRSHAHYGYVGLEVVKVAALVTGGGALLAI